MLRRVATSVARQRAAIVPAQVASSRRNYMSEAEMQEHLPARTQAAYRGVMAEMGEKSSQRVSHGVCDSVSRAVYSALRKHQQAAAGVVSPTRERSSVDWGKNHEKMVDQGYPAFVRAHGTTTEHSEWRSGGTGHAVTVVSRANDGSNFVVHDPDTTHDPRWEPSSIGRNLRLMTPQQLRSIRAVQSPQDQDGSQDAPMDAVIQHQPHVPSPFEVRAQQLVSTARKALGFIGFGGK